MEPTDIHRKQKQTNGGTDRHSRIPCDCNSTYRLSIFVTEKLNDIKGVIRGRNSKGRQYNRQKIKGKGQTIIHKTLQNKIKIEQHEPSKNRG